MSMLAQRQGQVGLGSLIHSSRTGVQLVGQMLSTSVLTSVLNVLVITLVVSMLVFSGLERYQATLEDSIQGDCLTPIRSDGLSKGTASLARDASTGRNFAAYKTIAARNLFETVSNGSVRPAAEEIEIEQMPLASLQLKLMGTVASGEPAMRTAIIAEANGRNEQIYREGEMVKEATVKKILRYAVVLNTGKRDEVLRMENVKSGKSGAGKRDFWSNTSVQAVALDRDMVKKTFRNIPGLLKSARFQRYRSGGINGFRIKSMVRGSDFSKLGLRSNDIILGVNGAPLTHFNQASQLYAQLERGEEVRLNIERGGKDHDILLRFK